MKKNKSVSVITLTQDREDQLIKCIDSVIKQDYLGEIEHIIIGNNSKTLQKLEKEIRTINPAIIIYNLDLKKDQDKFIHFYTPSKVGFMRNFGIRICNGEYICQLDDDNSYDNNHISSLVRTIESDPKTDIAYSWRKLVFEDGNPYLKEEYPWTPHARFVDDKGVLSRYIYQELVKSGIRAPKTNVVKDTLLTQSNEKVYTVDTSELMVKKKVHEIFLFTLRFTWRQMVGDYSDDYSFVKKCHEAGLKFRCSKKATMTYTIGGYSNKQKIGTDYDNLPKTKRCRNGKTTN